MKKIISFILLSSLMLLNGCLKEKNLLDSRDNNNLPRIVIEFTKGDSTTLNTLGVNIAPGLVEANLAEVRYDPHTVITSNVEFKVELDPALVDAYNAANEANTGIHYDIPPASIYSFTQHSYTLTPDAPGTNVKISVDPSALVGNSYALGFVITEVSNGEISGTRRYYIAELSPKNDYDGVYSSVGYFYHPTAARPIDRSKTLATLSPTAVECELADLGSNGYFAIFDVDPATNNVTITIEPGAAGTVYTMFTDGLPTTNPGYTPQWSGSSQCNNTYDPVSHQFKVRYGYMGANGWRVTEEILTLQ